jgi:predicted peptidase
MRLPVTLITSFIAVAAAAATALAAPAAVRPIDVPDSVRFPTGQSVHRLPLYGGGSDHLNYLVSIPPDYYQDSAVGYPIILFLHGSEQRGDNPELLKEVAAVTIAGVPGAFPFIAVFPQCPPDSLWPPTALRDLLDALEAQLRVDADRVYLTGFSMGGLGTWQTAAAFPHTFAAIAPICGMSDIPEVPRLTGIPIWAFHGAQDENVPVTESRKMIDSLRKSGADARLTVYPDLAHDCWTMTYRDSRLYLWFLDHSLSDGTRMAAGRTPIGAP